MFCLLSLFPISPPVVSIPPSIGHILRCSFALRTSSGLIRSCSGSFLLAFGVFPLFVPHLAIFPLPLFVCRLDPVFKACLAYRTIALVRPHRLTPFRLVSEVPSVLQSQYRVFEPFWLFEHRSRSFRLRSSSSHVPYLPLDLPFRTTPHTCRESSSLFLHLSFSPVLLLPLFPLSEEISS